MTGPTIGGGVAELTQSRNASASEALAIFRAQVGAFQRRLAAIRGYNIGRVALCLFLLGFVAIVTVGARMHWIPRIPPLLALPLFLLVAFGACRAWSRYYYRICARIYQDCYKADRRFRIEDDGVVAMASGVVSSIPWSAISDIVADKGSLTIYLSPLDAIYVPKAACENQDVESFCTELTRRWQQNRNAPQPEAAP